MSPVDKALWYIESREEPSMRLDDIAGHAGVSKYHLLRAFAAATGQSIMRYARGRRLTEAAVQLAAGAPDILSLAISSGYGSHEAFTRAFRDQFDATPESIRERGVSAIRLVPAIAAGDRAYAPLAPPRFETGKVLLIAGLNRYYAGIEAGAGIAAQWRQFAERRHTIRGPAAAVSYGVCYGVDDEGSLDYLSGVEVSNFVSLPTEMSRLRLPSQRYAVFTHKEHIAAVRGTWNTIWNDWLPRSGRAAVDAPLFERYDERFDWDTGAGGLELWVPLQ